MLESQCANCLSSLEPNDKFNFISPSLQLDKNEHGPEVPMKKISIAAALSTIFNISFPSSIVSEDQLYICPPCYVDFLNLFSGYVKFMYRQRSGSVISKRLKGEITEESKTKSTSESHTTTLNLNDKKCLVISKTLNTGDGGYNLNAPQANPTQIPVNKNEPIQNPSNLQSNYEEENQEMEMETEFEAEVEIKEEIDEQVEPDNYDDDPSQTVDTDFRPAAESEPESEQREQVNEDNENEELPTFEAEYNLPDPSEYSLFQLQSTELPLKCPDENCAKNSDPCFTSYSQYKSHVSSQHVHTQIFQCAECDYASGRFKRYMNHSVNKHEKKPLDRTSCLPDLNALLDKYLLPEAKSDSLEESANIWYFSNSDIVDKYDSQFLVTEAEAETGTGEIEGEIPPPAPPRQFKCEKCFLEPAVIFDNKEMYYYHLDQNIHESKVFQCDQCTCKFVGRNCDSRFIDHYERFHKLTLTPSDLSKYESGVQRLERIVTGDESDLVGLKLKVVHKGIYQLLGDPLYTCRICHDVNNGTDTEPDAVDLTFKSATELWKHHEDVHMSENIQDCPCPKCGGLRKRGSLILHIVTFCGREKPQKKRYLPPFICLSCDPPREFSTHKKLREHKKWHHEPRERIYTCDLCGKSYPELHILNSHMIYHRNERRHVCETCGKRYNTRTNLITHQKTAHDEEGRRKYNEHCRMKNKIKRMKKLAIQQHNQSQVENSTNPELGLQAQNDHVSRNTRAGSRAKKPKPPTGEGRKNRKKAGEKIANPSKSRTRTNKFPVRREKIYTCEQCGKSLTSKNGLDRHLAVHTNERPYVCETCGKSYKTRSNLSGHLRNSHDEEGRRKYQEYCRIKMRKKRLRMKVATRQIQKNDDDEESQ